MTRSHPRRNHSARGNALLLILIAVALFAALNYAIFRDRNDLKNPATRENALMGASEILQYGQTVRVTLTKMIGVNGVPDTTPTLFAAAGAHAAYGVPGTDASSEVFSNTGGAVFYSAPLATLCSSACAYEFTGQITVTGVGANPALAMTVFNVDPEVCLQINIMQKSGLTSVPTGAALATLDRFSGVYGGANAITLGGAMTGVRGFCYQESSGAQRYIFVYVLRVR
jgi:hypothetical protein